MRVGAIGDNCLDVYMEQGLLAVGGNALNAAANWARMGLDSAYVGAVGDDDAAEIVCAGVREAGLDADDVVTIPGPTGVTLIRLNRNDRQFAHEELGVGLDWIPDDLILDELAMRDWVHTAGTSPEARVIERLVERGARLSVDLSTSHDFERLDGVEIAFASWSGLGDGGARNLAERMTAAGAGIAVVMCGEDGSLVRWGAETATTKAEPISPVDTCGAGDSFIASYVASHLRGNGMQISLGQATASATQTCLHLAGFEQQAHPIPDWLKALYYPRASCPTA